LTFAATHVPHDRRLRDWPGLRKAEAIAHGLAQHAVGEVLKRECHPDRDDASAGGHAPGAAPQERRRRFVRSRALESGWDERHPDGEVAPGERLPLHEGPGLRRTLTRTL
jgi:hypothetical protein